jgi:outer membrane protein assembly factor BamB
MMYEDTLLLQFDQGSEDEEGRSKLMGFDPATGRERWATPRALPNSWASPALIEFGGRAELIACADPRVVAYDPASGKELWWAEGLSGDVAPSPAFDGQRIIVSNDGAQTVAIRPGGSGDVTATRVLWRSDLGMPDIPSPVSDGRHALLVSSAGWLTCLDAMDGALVWEKMLETSFSASPVAAGKFIYLCGQDGVTRIFELSDAYRLHGSGDVGEPIYVTPAFADGQIYIRGAKHLFCITAP